MNAIGIPTKPNSLSVKIPNVDISKIKDTRPLFDTHKEILLKRGYDKKQIEKMCIDDFNKLKRTWKLSPESISMAKLIYPELENIDISNWTFGDFEKYYTEYDNQTYSPSKDLEKKLAERNINLEDARYLLKEFHTYENILSQEDSELEKILEGRNKFNLDFVNSLQQYSSFSFIINADPPNEYKNKYDYINMPGYGWDWFHKNSGSSDPDTATWQSGVAKSAFYVIYGVNSSVTHRFTNMWGTYSAYSNATHEGIDMVYQKNPPVYSLTSGPVLDRNNTNGRVAIYDETRTNNTVFYNHLNTITVGSSATKYQQIGTQGKKGNADGEHVHLQVEIGQTTDQDRADEHNLDSANPYTFIYNNLRY